MAYFSIGMALHSEGSYEDVLALLTDGLAWTSGEEPIALPSKSAIFQARARLGSEPLQVLFSKVATPLARAGTPGVWLGGRRLIAIDGTSLDVADTPENSAFFGRPGVNKGEQAAFPQAGWWLWPNAGPMPSSTPPWDVHDAGEHTGGRGDRPVGARDVVVGRPGILRIPLWSRAVATGAHLLWRANSNMKPRFIETLSDGSWFGRAPPERRGKRQGPTTDHPGHRLPDR